MKRNIVFIGSMGSGKSHIGRNLANALGWQFVDTDRCLEQQYRKPIADIYEKLGEKGFIQAEQQVLKRVALYHEAVISVGGNFLMKRRTIHMLQRYSHVIFLCASEKRLVSRVKRRMGKRPTMNYEDINGFVQSMVQSWRPLCGECDDVLDTTYGDSEDLIQRVLDVIEKRGITFKKRRKVEKDETTI